jgi:hypothetical protein
MSSISSLAHRGSSFQGQSNTLGANRRRSRRRTSSAVAIAAATTAAVALMTRAPAAKADIVGFQDGTNSQLWQTNGSANFSTFSGTTAVELQLTPPANGNAGTAWYGATQTISNFTASFNYAVLSGSRVNADGVAFVLQNDPTGSNALGAGGGGLGYQNIMNSAAFEINIYSPHNPSGIATNVNGGISDTGDGDFLRVPGVTMASSNPTSVQLTYNGLILTQTVSQGGNTFSQATLIDLTAPLGGGTATVGFTGATGGENADQRVTGFSYVTGGVATNQIGTDVHNVAGDFNFTNGAGFVGGIAPSSVNSAIDSLILDATNSGTIHITGGTNYINNFLVQGGNTLSVEGGQTYVVGGGLQMANTASTNAATLTVTNGGRIAFDSATNKSTFSSGGGSVVVNVGNGMLSINSRTPTGGDAWVALADGAGSVGRMNLSAGGSVTISSWFLLGRNGGEGHLNVSGGTLNVPRLQGGQDNGIGDFTMTGGRVNVAGDFELGHSTPSTTAQASAPNFVGNFSGGRMDVGGSLVVGAWHNGFGLMNVSNGATINAGQLIVGRDDGASVTGNQGILNITGGTVNVGGFAKNTGVLRNTGDFIIGTGNALSSGTVNLSGGLLQVGGGDGRWIRMGFNGAAGTFNMTGGSVSLNGWTRIGESDGAANNTFNMSGGTFTITSGDGRFMVGPSGTGVFNMTGGVLNINGGGDALDLGDSGPFSHGIINHSAGTINVAGFVSVGNWGEGNAANSHGLGTYNISGNAVLNAGGMRLGHENSPTANVGDGAFNQTGGKVTLGSLHVGSEGVTQSGTYTMSAGTLQFQDGQIGNGGGGGIFTGTGVAAIGGTGVGNFNVNANGLLLLGGNFTNTAGITPNGGTVQIFNGPTLNIGTGPGSSNAHAGFITLGGAGSLTQTGTNIVMNGGAITFNGLENATTHNLPMNNIVGSNVSSLNFNPGSGNTYTNKAGVWNLSNSAIRAQSGVVDLSNVQIASSGTLIAQHGLVTGLQEGFVAGAFNETSANPKQGGAVLEPRFGNIAGVDSGAAMTVADLTAGTWRNNTTIVYTGEIFIPNTNGNNTGTVAFGESFDDSVLVKIDGQTLLRDTAWDNSTSSGSNQLSAGWHTVEFRFGQGGGGAGPDSEGGWDASTNRNPITLPPGFGIQFGTNGVTTFDARSDGTNGLGGGGFAGATQSNYVVPLDNGLRSLFRSTVDINGTEIVVADSTTLIAGTVTGNSPLNLNGISGGTVGATFTIPAKASPTANGVGDISLFSQSAVATLNLGLNNTLNARHVNVPAGSTLTVQGGGTLAAIGVMSVDNGGLVNFAAVGSGTSTAGRLTHQVGSLALTGTATVDLNNHELLLTAANPATVKTYLANAYDAAGNQDWGKPGLTSSVAKANPTVYSVGYAYGGDQSAIDAGVTTHGGTALGATQTIARAVLTGDANLDGSVNFFDIVQLLGYKYNTGQAASYTDGDLDYNGKVDFFDIVLLLSANYNTGKTYGPGVAGALGGGGPASAAPASLSGKSGHSASTASSAIAEATTVGTPGDGKPDFVYNPATGHLSFATDGGVFTTTGGAASFVSSLTISSASGELIGAGASSTFAGGTGATLTSTLLSSALTNSPGFTDGFDIGAVLPTGLTIAQLTADLTVKYQSLNGGSLKQSDILVPEPTGLALLGLGAAGLLARRRKNRLAK